MHWIILYYSYSIIHSRRHHCNRNNNNNTCIYLLLYFPSSSTSMAPFPPNEYQKLWSGSKIDSNVHSIRSLFLLMFYVYSWGWLCSCYWHCCCRFRCVEREWLLCKQNRRISSFDLSGHDVHRRVHSVTTESEPLHLAGPLIRPRCSCMEDAWAQ